MTTDVVIHACALHGFFAVTYRVGGKSRQVETSGNRIYSGKDRMCVVSSTLVNSRGNSLTRPRRLLDVSIGMHLPVRNHRTTTEVCTFSTTEQQGVVSAPERTLAYSRHSHTFAKMRSLL